MPLQTTGAISFSNIMAEYGLTFTGPRLFSEFYQKIGASSGALVSFSNFFGRSINDIVYGAGIFYFSAIGSNNFTLKWTHPNISYIALSWTGGSSNITSSSNIATLSNFAASNYTFVATPYNNANQPLTATTIGATIGSVSSGSGGSIAVATDFSSNIEGGGWMLLYEVTNPSRVNNNIVYTVDNSNALFNGTYNRVAYYMQFRMDTNTTTSNYVFATMDPLPGAANLNHMYVPDASKAFALKSNVSNMNVYTNYTSTVDVVTSNIGRYERWPSNYGQGTTIGDGSATTFDYDDSSFDTSIGYGCFQLHNITLKKTIFAWNAHYSSTPDIGFGNRPTADPDWTFAANYSTNVPRYWFLRAYVKSAGPTINSVTATSPTLTSITLQWVGNSYSNVIITLPNSTNTSPISSNITSYTASGLTGNTSYLFKITPYSSTGAAGSPYFYTTNTASSAIASVNTTNVNNSSIRLLWNYSLAYSNVSVRYGSSTIGPINTPSIVINNLIPSSSYTFTVTPYDSIGLAGMAASNTTTLPGTLAMGVLTASPTNNSLTVSWPNTTAASYVVTWPPSNTSGTLASNVSSYTVTNLTSNTSYTLTVTPYNINNVAGTASSITASTLLISPSSTGTTTNGNYYAISVATAGTGYFDCASNTTTASMVTSMSNLMYFYVTNSANNLNKNLFMWTSNTLTSGTYRIYFQPSAKTLTGNTNFTIYTSQKCIMSDGAGKYWYHDTAADQARLTTSLAQADMLTVYWNLSGSILSTYPGYHLFQSAKDSTKYIRHSGQVMWFHTGPTNYDFPYQPTVQTNHTVRFINPWNTGYYLGTYTASDANRLYYGNTGTQYWNMVFPDSNAPEYSPGISSLQVSSITTSSFVVSWASTSLSVALTWSPGAGSSGTLASSVSNYNITNLNSNTTYTVTATPYNGASALSPSALTIITPSLPSFTGSLSFSRISTTSILLQWNRSNSIYDYIQISWPTNNVSGNLTTQSNYLLSNLNANTVYDVTVIPYTSGNVVGPSVTTTTSTAANLGVGTITTTTISTNQITLQWSASNYHYAIVTWPTGQTSGQLFDVNTYTVTGLSFNTSYTFTVTPYTFDNMSGTPSTITASTISYLSGLRFTRVSGYMNDNPAFFATATVTHTGSNITNTSNVFTATNGIQAVNGSDNYSIEWSGFFYAPTTGTYTMYIASDDCGYLWVGNNAQTGNFTTANVTASYPGIHGLAEASNTVNLTAGTYYPYRAQFGENGAGDDCQLSFTPPGGTRSYNGSGYYFYMP